MFLPADPAGRAAPEPWDRHALHAWYGRWPPSPRSPPWRRGLASRPRTINPPKPLTSQELPGGIRRRW